MSLPRELAAKTILTQLAAQPDGMDHTSLITAVNGAFPGSPTVAAEPAIDYMLEHAFAERVSGRSRQQGFFSLALPDVFILTHKGERLAAELNGQNPDEMEKRAAQALLRRAEQNGALVSPGATEMKTGVDGIGPATAKAVFEQLIKAGDLAATSVRQGSFSFPAATITAQGRKKLTTAPAA